MKTAAWACLLLSVEWGSAQLQPAPASLIETRQAELTRLAPLYFIDLTKGDWKHEQFQPCPAFPRHAFARYARTTQPGVISSFVAVYPLDTPPASRKDKPWEGGILLIPAGSFAQDYQSVAERRTTQVVFNKVWSDELKASGHPNQFPALDWGQLADCYAAISGEQPAPPVADSLDRPPSPSINLATHPVSSVTVQLVGPNALPRYLHLSLDPRGMIVEVNLK